ncbi:hypothetical protein BCR44DRAFT_1442214 [Catenaria anguillulae PL171]|uniref:Uncharacterized protein n=1 Tax=Catenaria anguillulae PL171 TaxID=765915 RepID=A0A1Y2HAC0_9FUNG|nr:hypothetical protein BCR44DRAFT_1442214 [Catenaria anguillulae PL171]
MPMPMHLAESAAASRRVQSHTGGGGSRLVPCFCILLSHISHTVSTDMCVVLQHARYTLL